MNKEKPTYSTSRSGEIKLFLKSSIDLDVGITLILTGDENRYAVWGWKFQRNAIRVAFQTLRCTSWYDPSRVNKITSIHQQLVTESHPNGFVHFVHVKPEVEYLIPKLCQLIPNTLCLEIDADQDILQEILDIMRVQQPKTKTGSTT